jgi:hypothetical protein
MTKPVMPPGKMAVPKPAPETQDTLKSASWWQRLLQALGLCRHRWVLTNQIALPSAWEQIVQQPHAKRPEVFDVRLYRKALVTFVQCVHCGKLKQKVVRNP